MEAQEEPDFSLVIDRTPDRGALYLSGADFAASEEMLRKYEIKHIISAALVTYLSYTLVPKLPDVRHLELNLFDQPNLVPPDMSRIYDKSYYFIEDSLNRKENVLVHCIAGVSRSASIVLSYLIRKNQMSLPNAFEYLKSKRSCIHPNPAFVRSLKLYD